ncbi:uncharacterized protein LOC112084149 [Eutrema salsugineum]|uniref:uncharacterized protein LOC112084149 n=1 Tax=Eutrema salsugineum TaxID=72664 RepID=UPI000CECEBE0|nr:uncharacterized protein LOC112084149 [Eutrema salsugineum]
MADGEPVPNDALVQMMTALREELRNMTQQMGYIRQELGARIDRVEAQPRRDPVAVGAAQLTGNSLAWWDRNVAERRRPHFGPFITWSDMKFLLRLRVKRIGGGLNGTIFTRKVERAQYNGLHDLLHLAVQVEQQIKRKTTLTNCNHTNQTWNTSSSKPVDKGKAVEIDSRFKGKNAEAPKFNRAEQDKSSNNTSRTHDITCFRCQGMDHISRECPNQRVMIITPSGDYESQDEQEDDSNDIDEKFEYPDTGEVLVTRRVLSVLVHPEETTQKENIFHTRLASKYMLDRLCLEKTKHHRPYKLRWLNNQTELKISEQVSVPFSIGKYHDQVTCDVVPMQAGHLILGRPWQFDRAKNHNGRTNHYSFMHKEHKYNLAPLSPTEVHEMQVHMNKEAEISRNNLYLSSSDICKTMSSNGTVLLMIFKECLSTGMSNSELPPEVQAILNKFRDVFPKEIHPGLPPLRRIEHQIDLVPGSALLNKPVYRMNPEETKDLERQVRDLMDKAYIRESLSPCAVPVLLVPKKDGTWRMLDELSGSTIFSKVYLKSGYHQV